MEAEVAFKQIKKLIAELLTLTTPMEREELIVYLAAAREAISAVLMTERETKQMPVYFVSSALQGPEINYTPMEKLWNIRKMTPPDMPMEAEEELPNLRTLFMDRSSCVDGFEAGLILTNPEGAEFTYALRFRFDATNNEAEYEALIAGLRITEQIAKEPGMIQYLEKVKTLSSSFKKFSIKQIEAKPVSTITGNQVKKVIWDNIVCKFGLPGEIISDNGKQFRDNPFKDWCEKLCIRQRFAFQASTSQWLSRKRKQKLKKRIKARLDERSKDWIEEIPHVLWTHRTMIKSRNGDTPFSLTYGTEAVILVEIGMPTLRIAEINMVQNDEALEINLDLLEERKEQAAICEARSKAKMEKYYNSKVRNTSFKLGDLVYQNNDASHVKDSKKLSPKWEGPYEVTEALGKGAYKLRDRNFLRTLASLWALEDCLELLSSK
ncbi:reverse transcriptase domain-containing protein [Tanacetum coccineum]